MEERGPFYIKIGQLLSTRPDLVSETMMEEFKNLHEQVTVAPFETFEPTLAEDLGPRWRSMFKSIKTDKPLGAASLADVYGVVLAGGRPAVVKIQRPGVAAVMREDMALLRRLSRSFAKRAPKFNEVIDVSWIEIGRATSRANIPTFVNDMSSFVPTLQGASLETLDFGVSLNQCAQVLDAPRDPDLAGDQPDRQGTREHRGLRPLHRPRADGDGGIREVFQDLAFDLVAEAASEETAAKLIMDALIAMSASPEQARSLLRDFANREVTVQINSRRYPLLGEDPALRLLVALAAGKILLRRKSA
jgi:hypothetical protein